MGGAIDTATRHHIFIYNVCIYIYIYRVRESVYMYVFMYVFHMYIKIYTYIVAYALNRLVGIPSLPTYTPNPRLCPMTPS